MTSSAFFSPRRLAVTLSVLAALGLTACGGGVSVGTGGVSVGVGYYDDWGYDDDYTKPVVSIAVAEGVTRPGQVVRVAVAASDESGIESVTLFRRDFGGDVVVSTLGWRPYEWSVQTPFDGRSSVTYYAQARDNAGNRANSNTVTIAVVP
ncbi:MAG: hypothetical protein ACKOF9_12940 [Burkholderiales bacterium]